MKRNPSSCSTRASIRIGWCSPCGTVRRSSWPRNFCQPQRNALEGRAPRPVQHRAGHDGAAVRQGQPVGKISAMSAARVRPVSARPSAGPGEEGANRCRHDPPEAGKADFVGRPFPAQQRPQPGQLLRRHIGGEKQPRPARAHRGMGVEAGDVQFRPECRHPHGGQSVCQPHAGERHVKPGRPHRVPHFRVSPIQLQRSDREGSPRRER